MNLYKIKKNKKNLYIKVKKDLKEANLETERLKAIIEKNEKILAEKEAELANKVGDLGEMFGSVRQTSADFLVNFKRSFTASQFPEKAEVFEKFSNSKKLPTMTELTTFWHTMLDEIIQSGNVVTYETNVILGKGNKELKEVTRVGMFSAFSDGKYLKLTDNIDSLAQITVQPNSSYTSEAKEFEQSSDEIKSVLIDPTRGTLFEMLGNNPTIMDRINQGGIVGYIIIVLGVLGLIFALYKIVFLNLIHSKIKVQQKRFIKL